MRNLVMCLGVLVVSISWSSNNSWGAKCFSCSPECGAGHGCYETSRGCECFLNPGEPVPYLRPAGSNPGVAGFVVTYKFVDSDYFLKTKSPDPAATEPTKPVVEE